MKSLLILLLLLPTFSFAQTKAKTVVKKEEKTAVAKPASEWPTFKQELNQMAAQFKNKKLSKDAKLNLLPRSNMVLSDIQDLKYTASEKEDQIRTVVEFISASIETDFANSNADTIYFDYKANKKAYTDEINKLKSASTKEEIIEAFKALEEFERDAEKPQSESDSE